MLPPAIATSSVYIGSLTRIPDTREDNVFMPSSSVADISSIDLDALNLSSHTDALENTLSLMDHYYHSSHL